MLPKLIKQCSNIYPKCIKTSYRNLYRTNIDKVTKKDPQMKLKWDQNLTEIDKRGIIFRARAPDPSKIIKMYQKIPYMIPQVINNAPKIINKWFQRCQMYDNDEYDEKVTKINLKVTNNERKSHQQWAPNHIMILKLDTID